MEKPVLMENTSTSGVFIYIERVCSRMKNLRPIYREQVTPEMERKAGLLIGHFTAAKAPVKVVEPPDIKTQEEVLPPDGAPDTSNWDLLQLQQYAQDKEIPYHPAAKVVGLRSAIARHYERASVEAEVKGE